MNVAVFSCPALLLALTAAPLAHAQVTSPPGVFNAPIAFALPGSVTLTLEMSEGGFDHVLELASGPGPLAADPLLVLTATSDPSASVLGWTPAALGDSVNLGSWAAGAEVMLRLSNVESHRLGTPGTLAGQTFSGSNSGSNPQPAGFYTVVEWLSPTQLRVEWEDAFPVFAADVPTSLDGPDLRFMLTLSPVPEPSPQVLLLAGLGTLVWLARRRQHRG